MSQPSQKNSAFQCPQCGGKFALPSESTARRFLCPHCRQVIAREAPAEYAIRRQPSPKAAGAVDADREVGRDVDRGVGPEVDDQAAADEERTANEIERAANLERARRLLPPKFTARPPGMPDQAAAETAVLIPTAEGGFTAVASDVVRISHRGREVTLKKSSPSARRTWLSAVIVLVCAAVLLATFFWLLRSRPS